MSAAASLDLTTMDLTFLVRPTRGLRMATPHAVLSGVLCDYISDTFLTPASISLPLQPTVSRSASTTSGRGTTARRSVVGSGAAASKLPPSQIRRWCGAYDVLNLVTEKQALQAVRFHETFARRPPGAPEDAPKALFSASEVDVGFASSKVPGIVATIAASATTLRMLLTQASLPALASLPLLRRATLSGTSTTPFLPLEALLATAATPELLHTLSLRAIWATTPVSPAAIIPGHGSNKESAEKRSDAGVDVLTEDNAAEILAAEAASPLFAQWAAKCVGPCCIVEQYSLPSRLTSLDLPLQECELLGGAGPTGALRLLFCTAPHLRRLKLRLNSGVGTIPDRVAHAFHYALKSLRPEDFARLSTGELMAASRELCDVSLDGFKPTRAFDADNVGKRFTECDLCSLPIFSRLEELALTRCNAGQLVPFLAASRHTLRALRLTEASDLPKALEFLGTPGMTTGAATAQPSRPTSVGTSEFDTVAPALPNLPVMRAALGRGDAALLPRLEHLSIVKCNAAVRQMGLLVGDDYRPLWASLRVLRLIDCPFVIDAVPRILGIASRLESLTLLRCCFGRHAVFERTFRGVTADDETIPLQHLRSLTCDAEVVGGVGSLVRFGVAPRLKTVTYHSEEDNDEDGAKLIRALKTATEVTIVGSVARLEQEARQLAAMNHCRVTISRPRGF